MKDFFAPRVGKTMRIEEGEDGVYFVRVVTVTLADVTLALSHCDDASKGETQAKAMGRVKVSYRGMNSAGDLITSAIKRLSRRAIPSKIASSPPAALKPAPEPAAQSSVKSAVAKRIEDLVAGNGVGPEDLPPTQSSIERLMRIIEITPGILVPDVFATRTGALRCRWVNGSKATFNLTIPTEGDLGAFVSVSRDGERGQAKFSIRFSNEQDLPELARRFDVRVN